MEPREHLPLGIVVERRQVDHPWMDHSWAVVGVIPGAPARDPEGEWTLLRRGEGWAHYHGGTLPLELFRKETEGYKVNLSLDPPRLFVVLRDDEDPDSSHEVVPFLVTACPYEAQDYLDSGEDVVETLAMPPEVAAFVQAFVARYHVDEPFRKRKRSVHDPRKSGFAGRPPATVRGGGDG